MSSAPPEQPPSKTTLAQSEKTGTDTDRGDVKTNVGAETPTPTNISDSIDDENPYKPPTTEDERFDEERCTAAEFINTSDYYAYHLFIEGKDSKFIANIEPILELRKKICAQIAAELNNTLGVPTGHNVAITPYPIENYGPNVHALVYRSAKSTARNNTTFFTAVLGIDKLAIKQLAQGYVALRGPITLWQRLVKKQDKLTLEKCTSLLTTAKVMIGGIDLPAPSPVAPPAPTPAAPPAPMITSRTDTKLAADSKTDMVKSQDGRPPSGVGT